MSVDLRVKNRSHMSLAKQFFNIVLIMMLFVGVSPDRDPVKAAGSEPVAALSGTVPLYTVPGTVAGLTPQHWFAELVESREWESDEVSRLFATAPRIPMVSPAHNVLLSWPSGFYRFSFHAGFCSGLAPPAILSA